MPEIDNEIANAKKQVELLEYQKKIKDLKQDINTPPEANTQTTPGNSANPGKYQLLIASDNKRLINYFVDLFVIYVIASLFLNSNSYYNSGYSLYPNANWYITLYIVIFFYYIVCEGLTGKTIGKLLTRTRVVNKKGNTASLDLIITRSFIRLIPFDIFSFLGGKHPQGWHDKWSNTLVIDEDVDNYTSEEEKKEPPKQNLFKSFLVVVLLILAFLAILSVIVFIATPGR